MAPAVGDKITASAFDEEGNDVSAFCTWQWFRVTAEGNVVTISNATKQSYTVGAIDRGAVLYCEATDINGNLLKSNESSVMKATNVTEINVNGMTGQRPGDKDEFVAIAGDELEVELVPYGAAQDAEYQWYRSGAAIKGATEKTYVPTTADVGLGLSVKVKIPATAGYGISEDATTTNKKLELGATATGATYALTGTVTLDDVVCWDLSNSTPKIDNTKPAVGDTITVKVPFDKNGDGDETDTGDYLDLTSEDPDAVVFWYRGSIENKNRLNKESSDSYEVTTDDNGKALYVQITGATGSEFIGSCEATTDETNKTVMSTEIKRETKTTTTNVDMDKDVDPAMTKGTKLYVSTKDNKGDSVKDANLTFQWYRSGTAIDGATSSSYTLGDDDITKFKNDPDHVVTYKVVVNGKDGYTGTAKDTIEIFGATNTTAVVDEEDLSVKSGDYYLAADDVVNAGDTLTLAASYADSLGALDIKWWFTAKGDGTDVQQFTGASFTVPSDATMDSKIAVSVTKKTSAADGMWANLDFTKCNTNTTHDKASDGGAKLKDATKKVVCGENAKADEPTSWATLQAATNAGFLKCAKSLDSIDVTYKVGDRSLDAPEVGATMTVAVKPQLADLTYKWEVNGVTVDSNDDGTTATGAEVGEGANSYTITSDDVNKKIKVTVTSPTAGTAYTGASIKYETEAVAASSRTIAAVKVLKYDNGGTDNKKTDTWYVKAGDTNVKSDFINSKADFTNKKSVTAIETDTRYIIVAMDSDGEIIDSTDVSYNFYNFKSGVEKKIPNSTQRFTAGEFFNPDDIAHFEVAPNQIGYTGSAASYNLTSAVSDGGNTPDPTQPIGITIAPKATPATTDAKTANRIIAEGANITFKATLTGVDGNPSIKWFNGNGDQKGVGTEFNPGTKGLTELADGGFYAEITVGGTTYTSQDWTIQERVATSLSAASVTATTTGTTVKILDQFGATYTGAASWDKGATGTTTTTTVTAAVGTVGIKLATGVLTFTAHANADGTGTTNVDVYAQAPGTADASKKIGTIAVTDPDLT